MYTLEAKSGISCARLPETFLTSLYHVLAPYRGCAHGCVYCDGRAEKYFVEGDFASDIGVRTNIADAVAEETAGVPMANEFDFDAAEAHTATVGDEFGAVKITFSPKSRLREFGAVSIGSGVTDIYQNAEEEYGLTRKILENLAPTGLPAVILTKNSRILRDFDILKRFSRALIIVTVTTVNDQDAAHLEPGASSPRERLEVVRRAKEMGFFAGVMAMPLCPYISDTDTSVKNLIDASKAAGADFFYPGGLTLRPGRQKDTFLAVIDNYYPHLRASYDSLYRENRPSGMPAADGSSQLYAKLNRIMRAENIPSMIPHRVYRELLSLPDTLYVLYSHMIHLYSSRGVNTSALKRGLSLYTKWLADERTALRRKRLTPSALDPFPVTRIMPEKFMDQNLSELLQNEKLASLTASLLMKDAYFDYTTLTVTT